MTVYILGALISYLVGSINTAFFLSNILKKDMRPGGSGNLGASNATLTLGWKCGVLVGACDILKGFAVVFIARMVFPGYEYLPYIATTMAIIGHIFPFYLKFKGGKGFATLIGCILGYNWILFIIAGVLIIIITFATDYIVLATLTMIISFPVYVGISTHNFIYPAILAIGSICIFIKHIPNYIRIIKKEEIGIRSAFTKKHRI
jgi:glycerol-3-phosphate acyltransferase PlsY